MVQTIIVTGINGYIGQYLVLTQPENHQITGTARNVVADKHPLYSNIVIVPYLLEHDPESVLDQIKPSIIIHTAALANLAECESKPEYALQVNRDATEKLAVWCARHGARMIYLSTDIVFSGDTPPYDEKSAPDPINTYGRSKYEGELAVISQISNYAIIRIALALGRGLLGKQNFIDWFLSGLESGREINLFEDEVRTPTSVFLLAKSIWQIALSNETGIFHLCSRKSINRYELGKLICKATGNSHDLLQPIQSAQIKGYPRPLDVSLKSIRTFHGETLTMPAIDSLLESVLKKYI